jgi:hypothetical protein
MGSMMKIDLENPLYAYMFGFLQADGHLAQGVRQKGRLSLEVSAVDRFILEQFASIVPCYSSVRERVRNTNFKVEYRSTVWAVSDLAFREALIALGLPTGRKSISVNLPTQPFSRPDYFRGWIDADGSLGVAGNSLPFVSLTTASDDLAKGYLDFVQEIIGKRKTRERNTRDKIYNLMVWKEDAQSLIEHMYYEKCLALPRKVERAFQAKAWIRPANMRRSPNRKAWTDEQDAFILSHSIEDSISALGRTFHSINARIKRLHRSSQPP